MNAIFQLPENVASACGATASGAASAWSFAIDAADVIFGMPIQVVLACFASSAAARTTVGQSGWWRTAGTILLYAAIGAWVIPLPMHLFGLPTSAQAAVGVIVSGGMQLPPVREWMFERIKAIFGRDKGTPPQ